MTAYDDVNSLYNQARLCVERGQPGKATGYLEKAQQLNPQSAEILQLLGTCYLKLGQPEKTLEIFKRIISLEPTNAFARLNLGKVFFLAGNYQMAITPLQDAIRLDPSNFEAYQYLCNALILDESLVEAIDFLEKARELSPRDTGLLSALAMTYFRLGMVASAQPVCAELVRLEPESLEAHSAWVYSFCYLPEATPEARYREHVRWGERHAPPVAIDPGFSNARAAGRRLRVGYVSADFVKHSVAYFLEPLLAHHDKQAVEIFCYANLNKFDEKTNDFRQLADHWFEIKSITDALVAERIRSDQIDILVDLAGHTAGNRLGVFARKPAPLQVSYIGYPATTGMITMDYRLTDAEADPPGMTEHLHTETLMRLPEGFLCYRPPDTAPAVQPPPCLASGSLTFGSFNSMAKLSPQLITVWARLLLQIPDSRLLLKSKALRHRRIQDELLEQFAAQGICKERLELTGWLESVGNHLDLYSQIDIALDTFPYNGTTTTCEALWMGVPVITLAGQEHVGRVGVSLLKQVGLEDWIADSEVAYIRQAVAWAGKQAELTTLRKSLREQMASSRLCNAAAHTRTLEKAYREMWQGWLKRTEKG